MPIEKGPQLVKYQQTLEKVRAAQPDLKSPIDTYAWHGTRGDYANLIVKGGFDMSHAGESAGRFYTS